MNKKIFLVFISVILLCGCTKAVATTATDTTKEVNPTYISKEVEEIKDEESPIVSEIPLEEPKEDVIEEKNEQNKDETGELSSSDEKNRFTVPDFKGEPFEYVNSNQPFFIEDEIVDESYEYYSPLDDLGRAGYAMCCCGTDLFPQRDRSDISMVYPTGWEQNNYDFIDNEGWLYNRCHLIAYSLTGIDGENEEDIPLLERNLITGTRYFNFYGMWPIESTVYYYLKDNPENHVMYRVTPIINEDDLLCQGVLMEGYSGEDEGKGCKFCVFVFNVQPGVVIDYKTGENYIED